MAISAVNGKDSANVIANATQKVLGKDDFLKLLMTELRYQDALDPVKDKEFIAQMAQFSSLEQATNLAEEFAKFAAKAGKNEALSMLGRTVDSVDVETGATISGTVTGVKYTSDEPEITIEGDGGLIKIVKLSGISRVSIGQN